MMIVTHGSCIVQTKGPGAVYGQFQRMVILLASIECQVSMHTVIST